MVCVQLDEYTGTTIPTSTPCSRAEANLRRHGYENFGFVITEDPETWLLQMILRRGSCNVSSDMDLAEGPQIRMSGHRFGDVHLVEHSHKWKRRHGSGGMGLLEDLET